LRVEIVAVALCVDRHHVDIAAHERLAARPLGRPGVDRLADPLCLAHAASEPSRIRERQAVGGRAAVRFAVDPRKRAPPDRQVQVNRRAVGA
jgi:hypothetical protein